MKLFTKDINQKLFAQYRIGSNLNEQNVVAKIFNPYGIGRWYLLNSDPNDPDYLWAIVQMGDVVEVGSVLRSELETIRVKPFGLPLERDMYFSDRNAMEVLDGLEKGKTFAHGGMTAGRYYKDNSGNEFRFIGESEGKLLFKDGEKIVTKSEEDFEDAPKEKKLFGIFAEGGKINDWFEKPNNLRNIINKSPFHIELNNFDCAKKIKNKNSQVEIIKLVNPRIKQPITYVLVIKNWTSVDELKNILIECSNHIISYGFTTNEQIDSYKKMADGGNIEATIKKRLSKSFDLPLQMAVYVPSTKDKNVVISKKELAYRVKVVEKYLATLFGGFNSSKVDGGFQSVDKGVINEDAVRVVAFANPEGFEPKFEKLVNKVKEWCRLWSQESIGLEFENDLFYIEQDSKFAKGGKVKNPHPDYPDFVSMQYADGGDVNSFKLGDYVAYARFGNFYRGTKYYGQHGVIIGVKNTLSGKLFDVYLPSGVIMTGVSSELKIDKEPKALFIKTTIKNGKIIKGTWDKNTKMADGGIITPEKPIEKMTKLELMRFVEKINPMKNFYPKTTIGGRVQAKNIYQEYLDRKKMAKGGEMAKKPAKFKDKVKAISKSLEGKKVPKRVRKDYGATYDKKESVDAAKRIAGTMVKKERKRYGI
jgi:hypothetical protein